MNYLLKFGAGLKYPDPLTLATCTPSITAVLCVQCNVDEMNVNVIINMVPQNYLLFLVYDVSALHERKQFGFTKFLKSTPVWRDFSYPKLAQKLTASVKVKSGCIQNIAHFHHCGAELMAQHACKSVIHHEKLWIIYQVKHTDRRTDTQMSYVQLELCQWGLPAFTISCPC